MHEEFYIGWQAEAPASFARVVRRFVVALCLIVPVLAASLVFFQRGFSNGVFEFGQKTELEGIFTQQPFPFLTIENGKDAAGKPVFQTILLVGEGKFGFATGGATGSAALRNGENIKVSGFLIYRDGKVAFQVDKFERRPASSLRLPPSTPYSLSLVQLRGEITDPKCLLGVMKPGQGKPHRDCAARCIAGGIPPVLKVANAAGEAEYYLLAGPDGAPLNDSILQYAGDGVELCGRLEQQGDWPVLYTDPGSIRRINKGALAIDVMCN